MIGKWQGLSRLLVMLLAMGVSVAMAGPEQDLELADRIYATSGDLTETMALLRKAAEQGYAPAQVRLGYILDKAELNEESVKWYQKAAEQGYAPGEYGLGYMYSLGKGVKKDMEQARFWVLRAAEKDHLPAVIMLMEAYKAGDLGLTPDIEKARLWEEKARVIRDTEAVGSKKSKEETK